MPDLHELLSSEADRQTIGPARPFGDVIATRRRRDRAAVTVAAAGVVGAVVGVAGLVSTQTATSGSSRLIDGASPSPAPRLARIYAMEETDRQVALPVSDGRGDATLALRPFTGDYEVTVTCIGGGSLELVVGAEPLLVGGPVRRLDCNGQVVGFDLTANATARSLRVHASPSQSWRVAVMTGHTPRQP